MRDNALHSPSPDIAFDQVAPSSRCLFLWSQCGMLSFCLFGWSRMTSAGRSSMKEALSQIAVMDCHSVEVLVEGKASQCS